MTLSGLRYAFQNLLMLIVSLKVQCDFYSVLLLEPKQMLPSWHTCKCWEDFSSTGRVHILREYHKQMSDLVGKEMPSAHQPDVVPNATPSSCKKLQSKLPPSLQLEIIRNKLHKVLLILSISLNCKKNPLESMHKGNRSVIVPLMNAPERAKPSVNPNACTQELSAMWYVLEFTDIFKNRWHNGFLICRMYIGATKRWLRLSASSS